MTPFDTPDVSGMIQRTAMGDRQSIQIAPIQSDKPKMSMTGQNFTKPMHAITPLTDPNTVREESLPND